MRVEVSLRAQRHPSGEITLVRHTTHHHAAHRINVRLWRLGEMDGRECIHADESITPMMGLSRGWYGLSRFWKSVFCEW